MTSGLVVLLPIIIGSLGAMGCLFGAFWALRRKRLIDDLPTSKTQGVFIGLAELKGTAESEKPLISYLAGTSCVYYAWQIDEQWSRIVVETYSDSKGVHTRTRTESGWTNVARGGQNPPFYLMDDTGVIRITPDGAEIRCITTFNQTFSPRDPLYFGKGPIGEIANTTHRRRFHETDLPLHASLYIMGQARERQDVVAAEIARDKKSPMFLISTSTEKQISSSYGRWLWFWLVLGILLASGGSALWGVIRSAPSLFVWRLAAFGAAGFLLVLALGWVWAVYNSLVILHHRVEQGWSQVDVQLKRRHDLIPNLVSVVEGYRIHESETQKALAEFRTKGEANPDTNAQGIAAILTAVVENYPDLKASDSFLRLQKELVETEERIALARDYFNGIATFYNNRLGIIPDSYVAKLGGLHSQELMCATDFERAHVQVKLASE